MSNVSPLEILVDLRESFPSIRDQEARPLCLVFSSSDLNSNTHGLTEPLSVEYLAYYSYQAIGSSNFDSGLPVHAVVSALQQYGQPLESDFPYSPSNYKPSQPSGEYSNLKYASGNEVLVSPDEIISSLESNKPIVIGVQLSSSFFEPQPPFIFDQESGEFGGHAITIVGYGITKDEDPVFLIRNSWGADWADQGHAWLTSNFIQERSMAYLELNRK